MNKFIIVVGQTLKKSIASKSFVVIMLLPFIFLTFVSFYLITIRENINLNFSSGFNSIIQNEQFKKKIIATICMLIIFLFIGTSSNMIAQEIGSDKGTKMMEVILTSITSKKYFLGKLVGVFLLCIVQLVIYGVAALIGISLYNNLNENLNEVLFNLISVFNIWNLIFLIFGIISYAFIAALLGSFVTKKEEVSNAANPILALSLVGVYIGLWLANSSPNGIFVKICSYLPCFSPFVMPMRMTSMDVSTISILISILILILYSIGIIFISLMLYSKNALNYNNIAIFNKKSLLNNLLKN